MTRPRRDHFVMPSQVNNTLYVISNERIRAHSLYFLTFKNQKQKKKKAAAANAPTPVSTIHHRLPPNNFRQMTRNHKMINWAISSI